MSRLPDAKQTVGDRIAQLRGDMTHVRFAALLGIDRKTVARWETGPTIPDGASLLALRQAFNANPTWVLTGEEAPPALSQRERTLLAGFRAASKQVQEAALRVLEGEAPPSKSITQNFMDRVGTVATGDAHVTNYMVQEPAKPSPMRPTGTAAKKAGPRK